MHANILYALLSAAPKPVPQPVPAAGSGASKVLVDSASTETRFTWLLTAVFTLALLMIFERWGKRLTDRINNHGSKVHKTVRIVLIVAAIAQVSFTPFGVSVLGWLRRMEVYVSKGADNWQLQAGSFVIAVICAAVVWVIRSFGVKKGWKKGMLTGLTILFGFTVLFAIGSNDWTAGALTRFLKFMTWLMDRTYDFIPWATKLMPFG
jgi:hypothetical protein